MRSESDLHRRLKQAACKWLYETGYAAVAEEVAVPGVGVIDVVAAGRWQRRNPRRVTFGREPSINRHHVVFVECKAMRGDFLRDQGYQHQFAFALSERADRFRARRPHRPRHASQALGKFDTCLVRPHANLHYLLTPPRLVRLKEVPRRWGLMTYDSGCVRVLRKPQWQEVADIAGIEGSIARSLTADSMRRRSTNGDRPRDRAFGQQPAAALVP